jgi:hypothetical protein
MKLVYLCGPINGRSDAECVDWREEAKKLLSPMPTLDPMARDYRGRELEPGIAREIVENDKTDIDRCAAMLVMFDRPSVGTSMEILYAWTPKWPRAAALTGPCRVPVYVVNASNAPLSPWLVYHAQAIFPSLSAACAHIKESL